MRQYQVTSVWQSPLKPVGDMTVAEWFIKQDARGPFHACLSNWQNISYLSAENKYPYQCCQLWNLSFTAGHVIIFSFSHISPHIRSCIVSEYFASFIAQQIHTDQTTTSDTWEKFDRTRLSKQQFNLVWWPGAGEHGFSKCFLLGVLKRQMARKCINAL